MLGFEVVAAALAAQGVEVVFGLMGDANLKLVMQLKQRHGVRYISVRHEATAVSMADGYARATGKLGVCTVTRGPGVTNTATAMTSAVRAGNPVVLVAGDTTRDPRAVRGLAHLQDTDQPAFFRTTGADVLGIEPGTVATRLPAALSACRSLSRPLVVNMPVDVQEAPCAVPAEAARAFPCGPAFEPDAGEVADLASRLSAARRPLILAGKGAVRAGATGTLVELADRTGALLATTLMAKDAFRAHPFDLGVAGGFSSKLAARLIGQADLVLAFGASLNDHTTKSGTIFSPDAEVVLCDRDPTHPARFQRLAGLVHGDARLIADALLAELGNGTPASGFRVEGIRAAIATHDPITEFADGSGPDGVDPRTLTVALDRVLPPERVLVVDSGHHCGFSSGLLRVPGPDHFMFALDFSAVGLGLGTALGAAVGRPHVLTVLAIGDGGLLMNLGDLSTAASLGLPLLVVVYNDRGFGAEVHLLTHLGMPPDAARFDTPDLAAVARSLGLDAVTVTSVADVAALGDRIRELDGPLLLDCRVNPWLRAGWVDEQNEIRARQRAVAGSR